MSEFRGKPCCSCLAAWLPAYERELIARKVIATALDVYQLTGTAPQSAGTHAGGAFDTAQTSPTAIAVAREMGADATWRRRAGWDGGTGIEHTHGVLTGCPHNAAARYQIDAVRAGFNGLGKGGRGGFDDGPVPLSGRTWEQGIGWADTQLARRERAARRSKLAEQIARLRTRIARLRARRKALL